MTLFSFRDVGDFEMKMEKKKLCHVLSQHFEARIIDIQSTPQKKPTHFILVFEKEPINPNKKQ